MEIVSLFTGKLVPTEMSVALLKKRVYQWHTHKIYELYGCITAKDFRTILPKTLDNAICRITVFRIRVFVLRVFSMRGIQTEGMFQ